MHCLQVSLRARLDGLAMELPLVPLMAVPLDQYTRDVCWLAEGLLPGAWALTLYARNGESFPGRLPLPACLLFPGAGCS